VATHDRILVVTGATGRQGGAVVRHLLADGWQVRGLTRKPGGKPARRLAGLGAEVERSGGRSTAGLPDGSPYARMCIIRRSSVTPNRRRIANLSCSLCMSKIQFRHGSDIAAGSK
jgi:NAD(P)-dependent dehydrogenase (short-subunit alcohol dehydrogenase family)